MTPREVAIKIVRLYVRTPQNDRHAKLTLAGIEGHGPAFVQAIEDEGMLSPIVSAATGLTGNAAFALAKEIIALAANTPLFPRGEQGEPVYPRIRPVGEFGSLLLQDAPKSVLDDDDTDDNMLADPSAVSSLFETIPSLNREV